MGTSPIVLSLAPEALSSSIKPGLAVIPNPITAMHILQKEVSQSWLCTGAAGRCISKDTSEPWQCWEDDDDECR